MALIYQTTMSPTKLDLLAQWLPKQTWFRGNPDQLESLGSYRIDDPDGEVGLESILLTAGDATVYHVPLSYRSGPIAGADAFLLGTSDHGVLGTRWVSDAAGDPVYRAVLAATISQGGRQADELIEDAEGNRSPRDSLVRVQGTGRPGKPLPQMQHATAQNVGSLTRIENDDAVLDIVRVVDPAMQASDDQLTLQGTWASQAAPTVLAVLYAA